MSQSITVITADLCSLNRHPMHISAHSPHPTHYTQSCIPLPRIVFPVNSNAPCRPILSSSGDRTGVKFNYQFCDILIINISLFPRFLSLSLPPSLSLSFSLSLSRSLSSLSLSLLFPSVSLHPSLPLSLSSCLPSSFYSTHSISTQIHSTIWYIHLIRLSWIHLYCQETNPTIIRCWREIIWHDCKSICRVLSHTSWVEYQHTQPVDPAHQTANWGFRDPCMHEPWRGTSCQRSEALNF